MKTKTFLLACLLLVIGLTQLSGQNSNSQLTRAYQGWFANGWGCPVFCNDVMVDELEGIFWEHCVDVVKNDFWVKEVAQLKGEATSTRFPYEVFQVNELDKIIPLEGANNMIGSTWISRTNLVGNMGHHYVVFLTISLTRDAEGHLQLSYVVDKAICSGSNGE
jgi:hypothetical protein